MVEARGKILAMSVDTYATRAPFVFVWEYCSSFLFAYIELVSDEGMNPKPREHFDKLNIFCALNRLSCVRLLCPVRSPGCPRRRQPQDIVQLCGPFTPLLRPERLATTLATSVASVAAAVRSRRSSLARRPLPPLAPAPPLPRSRQQQRRRQRIWRWRLRTLDSRAPRRDVARVPAPAVSRCSREPSESSTGPSRATSTRAASAGSPRGFRPPTSTANSVSHPPVDRLRTREGSRRPRPSAQLRTRRASMSH